MNCPACYREGLNDSETGYAGSDICPSCHDEGWDIDSAGELIVPPRCIWCGRFMKEGIYCSQACAVDAETEELQRADPRRI
jgi:hypothetical protein